MSDGCKEIIKHNKYILNKNLDLLKKRKTMQFERN